MSYKREFKSTDPPVHLHIKIARTELVQLRQIAGDRSLSFAILELLRIWRGKPEPKKL